MPGIQQEQTSQQSQLARNNKTNNKNNKLLTSPKGDNQQKQNNEKYHKENFDPSIFESQSSSSVLTALERVVQAIRFASIESTSVSLENMMYCLSTAQR